MITVTVKHEWDMAHRLPLHDGKCKRLHGHRYVTEIDVAGTVNTTTGIIIDFVIVRDAVKDAIGVWDHRCMLHDSDPIALTVEEGCLRVSFMPTAENIAQEIVRLLMNRDLNVVRVRVYETPNGWAEVKF
jgi:6-pyruvoyltetrahydropterin/6-carboxytetrahydropterin synthase